VKNLKSKGYIGIISNTKVDTIVDIKPISILKQKVTTKNIYLVQPNSLKYGIFGHLEGRILNKGPLDH
jgi:hypothetical protein